MSRAVEILVTGANDGGELLECLWRQGFPAELIEDAGAWRVEVRSPREETARLVADLSDAVARWLPEQSRRPRIEPVR